MTISDSGKVPKANRDDTEEFYFSENLHRFASYSYLGGAIGLLVAIIAYLIAVAAS